MTPGQIFLTIITIALIIVTYIFGPLTSIKETPSASEINASQVDSFNIKKYTAEKITGLPVEALEGYNDLISEAASSETDSQKADNFNKLITLLNENDLPVVASGFLQQKAEVTRAEEDWQAAGNSYLQASFINPNNQGLNEYLVTSAIECYEKAVEINPENLEIRISLATAYLDGTNQPMQGVTILLDIVDKDPDNITANLILGRYGILSGQFNKAVTRLETVIQNDSLNAEAYFYLAEAYNGLGNTGKAIELFERCKMLVSNPEFTREIDNYIEKLKNS